MRESGPVNHELSQQEAKRQAEADRIVERIGDPRLRADEHLEYFTLHLGDKVRHVPKRRIHESAESNQYIEIRLRNILEDGNDFFASV